MRVCAFLAALFLLVAIGPDRLEARPTLLFEPATNKVFYAEDIDQSWHPASLTKIMTAYVVFEAIKSGKITLQTKIITSEAANKMPASKIGLPVGAKMRVELALRALIIKSANDVAVMLAEAVGGSHDAFIARMNATAKRLGMSRTVFVNPNGLPADAQVTTARDLAKLATAIRRDFPQYDHFWGAPSMRIGKRRLRSYNGLLRTFEGADGLKTGFICDSGYNIVASAMRNGRRLVAIVLGEVSSRARAVRAASLLEHGFNTYGWKLFFSTAELHDIPISTQSIPAPSLRSSIPSVACNPALARRRHRAKRRTRNRARRKLRRPARKKARSKQRKQVSAKRTTATAAQTAKPARPRKKTTASRN